MIKCDEYVQKAETLFLCTSLLGSVSGLHFFHEHFFRGAFFVEDELLLALDSLPGLYAMAQQVQPRIVRRKVSRKPMPPCITGCESQHVINGKLNDDNTVGSGSHTAGKRVYSCLGCFNVWQQKNMSKIRKPRCEMSDRLGIVRYFWGERTAIMNGVATIRNGLALGGSNRIAGGM